MRRVNAAVVWKRYARLLATIEFGIGLPNKYVEIETQVRMGTEKIRISTIKFRQNLLPVDEVNLLFILS